jgi:ABC-type multidrug transport system ATPase subunit
VDVATLQAPPRCRDGERSSGRSEQRYGDLAAVDGLDLTVERGALRLRSDGAGKTTTIGWPSG